jgi:hypothetical protein
MRWVGAGDFLQIGEALRAVGREILCLPPALDLGEPAADALARRQAECGHVAAGERKNRRPPAFRERQELGEPIPVDLPIGCQQQCQIAKIFGAEPVEGAPPAAAIAFRSEPPRWGQALQPIAPGIGKTQAPRQGGGAVAVDLDDGGATAQRAR